MSSENYAIRNQNAVHFLTFTVIDWIDVFIRANNASLSAMIDVGVVG